MQPVHHQKPEHAWILSRTSAAGADPRTQPWHLMLGGHRRGGAPALLARVPRPNAGGDPARGRRRWAAVDADVARAPPAARGRLEHWAAGTRRTRAWQGSATGRFSRPNRHGPDPTGGSHARRVGPTRGAV